MNTLLSEIESFVSTHDMSERAFGQNALNDSHFVRQLRAGREPRRATVEAARAFMASYKPEARAA